MLWLFYEAIGGGVAGCCLYNCWGIRWVLTHLVRVCLKIDLIFLTVFFHSLRVDMLEELSFHENAENSAIWAMVNRPGVLDDD